MACLYTKNYHICVYSQRKVGYPFSWQSKYSNLKATSYIKPKFFFWTKLHENLILMKYLISVATPLISVGSRKSTRRRYFFTIKIKSNMFSLVNFPLYLGKYGTVELAEIRWPVSGISCHFIFRHFHLFSSIAKVFNIFKEVAWKPISLRKPINFYWFNMFYLSGLVFSCFFIKWWNSIKTFVLD